MSLSILGLDPLEGAAYEAAARTDALTPDALARGIGVTPEGARILLDRLVAANLASRHGNQYVAVRPTVALGGHLARQHGALRAAEAQLAALEDSYRTAHAGRLPDVMLDIVHGPDAVAARLEQLQNATRQEVLSFVKAPVSVLGSEANTAEDHALQRGVHYRVVLEQAMFDEEPRLVDEVHAFQSAQTRARVAASVPIKLFIFDRELALVPLGLGHAPAESALLVGSGGLLDALLALFDAVWETARPVTAQPTRPDDLDTRILALLLAGLTDEAVARDLGTSLRTVQRRVRSLLDSARADTRIQLGFIACQRGWVSDADSAAV